MGITPTPTHPAPPHPTPAFTSFLVLLWPRSQLASYPAALALAMGCGIPCRGRVACLCRSQQGVGGPCWWPHRSLGFLQTTDSRLGLAVYVWTRLWAFTLLACPLALP